MFNAVVASALALKNKQLHRVFFFGNAEMKQELQENGLEALSANEFDASRRAQFSPEDYFDFEKISFQGMNAQAVLVGFDSEFNYQKTCYASILAHQGVPLFATNPDLFTFLGSIRKPGTGSHLASIQATLPPATPITVLGKPSKFALEAVLNKHGLAKQDTLMVGDNIDTDVAIGNNAGVDSALVLTGVTRETDIAGSQYVPTFVLDHL